MLSMLPREIMHKEAMMFFCISSGHILKSLYRFEKNTSVLEEQYIAKQKSIQKLRLKEMQKWKETALASFGT